VIEITDEELVDVEPLQEKTSTLVRQYFQLYSRLQDQQSLLAEVYDHTKEFATSVQDLQEWLPVATAQLEGVDVASAEPSVEAKLETVQVRLYHFYRECELESKMRIQQFTSTARPLRGQGNACSGLGEFVNLMSVCIYCFNVF
jgi:hypothetical protein